MGSFPTDPSDERPPIWEQTELWRRAAAAGRLFPVIEREAVKLINPGHRVGSNYYGLRLGTQRLLHAEGEDAFEWIKRVGGFDSACYWALHREWLEQLFTAYYRNDEEAIGWLSLITAQRPPQDRSLENPEVRVEVRPDTETLAYGEMRRCFRIGDLVLPTLGLRLACASEASRRKCHLATLVRARSVRCARFGVQERYREVRVCLGREGEDDHWLMQGMTPGLPQDYFYDGGTIVGMAPILNLIKVRRNLLYTVLALAIHPYSGEVLNIRWYRMPLAGALLCASSVEHAALCEVLHATVV